MYYLGISISISILTKHIFKTASNSCGICSCHDWSDNPSERNHCSAFATWSSFLHQRLRLRSRKEAATASVFFISCPGENCPITHTHAHGEKKNIAVRLEPTQLAAHRVVNLKTKTATRAHSDTRKRVVGQIPSVAPLAAHLWASQANNQPQWGRFWTRPRQTERPLNLFQS